MPNRKYTSTGKHLPDPFTHEKRGQTGVATSEHIQAVEKLTRGINPSIERSIPIELKHIRAEGTRRGITPQLILHKEAEALDDLASRWTDHLVSALKKAKVITTQEQANAEWDRQFHGFIERRVRKLGIRHVDDLIREIDSIVEYTRIPKIVHERRIEEAHTRAILLNRLKQERVNPELNLLQTIKHTLSRGNLPADRIEVSQTVLKAIDVCLAAGVYADLKIATTPKAQHPISWTRHFRNGMHLIWESELLPNNVATAIKKLER